MKVLLTLLDGMRPDALTACGSEFANELLQNTGTYTLTATTVMPSVTLPCHMSLFHSVPPERHGIVTNIFTPQVRPVQGICERVRAAGKNQLCFMTGASFVTLHSLTLSTSVCTYQVT